MSTPKRRARANRSTLGAVEKLPSGRWRARYERDGATFKAPRTFDTKTDAQTWLAAERADRARGAWIDPRLGQERFGEFTEAWLASRVDLAPRTRALYRLTLDLYVLPLVGGARGVELSPLTLAEITPAVVRAWRAAVLTEARERIANRAAQAERRGPHPARAWGQRAGYTVHPTGRISPEVMTAWERAGSPYPEARAQLIEDDSGDPGRTTAASAYRLLRTVMNAAVHDGLVQSNPCQIPGAGATHAPERPTATPEEVATIAANMPAHLAASVLLAAWSGLRFGEVFALARKHVDIDAGTVRVERSLVIVNRQPIRFGKPKTNSSRRTVYLPGFVVVALREHLAEHVPGGPNTLLFTNAAGDPFTPARLSAVYRRARAIAGRDDLRFHDLRHTGATLAYTAGASVREVQNRLGHSTMRAASIYAHATDDSDRVLAQRLDALYSSPPLTPPTGTPHGVLRAA